MSEGDTGESGMAIDELMDGLDEWTALGKNNGKSKVGDFIR